MVNHQTEHRISGKLELAKIIRYAFGRKKKMQEYLENGFLELDNNCVERSIYCLALGRKNYLFIGSEGEGKATAYIYTLIKTAKINNVAPEAWLKWVLSKIADQKTNKLDEVLPCKHAQQTK